MRHLTFRKLLLLSALLCVPTLLWLWQPLASLAAECAIKSYCRATLKGSFSAAAVTWREGAIFIDAPTLASKRPLEQGGYQFTARQLKLSCSLSPWETTLDINVEMMAPHFFLNKRSRGLFESLLYGEHNQQYLKIIPHLKIREGQLIYAEKQPIPFEITFNSDLEAQSSFELAFGDDRESNILHGKIASSIGGERYGAFVFDSVDGPLLLDIAALFDSSFSQFDLQQATFDGVISVMHDKKGFALRQGDFTVSNFEFNHCHGHLQTIIPRLKIHLEPLDHSEIGFVGKFALESNCRLTLLGNSDRGDDHLLISSLSGDLIFREGGETRASMHGSCRYGDKWSEIAIDGLSSALLKPHSALKLKLELIDQGQQLTSLHFAQQRRIGRETTWQCGVKNFGHSEMVALSAIVKAFYPEAEPFNLRRGNIAFKARGGARDGSITRFIADEFSLSDVNFAVKSQQLQGEIASAEGRIALDFSASDPASSLTGFFNIDGASLSLSEWRIEDITGQGAIEKGQLQLKAAVSTFGLSGQLNANWQHETEVVNLHLVGIAGDVIKNFPLPLQQGAFPLFAENTIVIDAAIDKLGNGLMVNTVALLADRQADEQQQLNASCLITNTSLSEWLLGDFKIDKGSFDLKGVALEKFATPFIFARERCTLSGYGDFFGLFDSKTLAVQYQLHNFRIENGDLSIECPATMGSEGSHFFNFADRRHSGRLEVERGLYFDKNSGLLFTDVATHILFEGEKINATQLTTQCNGLTFAGNIEIDYAFDNPNTFDVDVAIDRADGTVAAAHHFLAHFNSQAPLTELPLDGLIQLNSQGSRLHFGFTPEDFALQFQLTGKLSNCRWEVVKELIDLQGLSLGFEYNHKARSLSLNDICGDLTFSDKGNSQYALSNGSIDFSDLESAQALFKLSLCDGGEELMQLMGQTERVTNAIGDELLQFTFDREKSLLVGAEPPALSLRLRDDFEVDHFALKLAFDIEKFAPNIARIAQLPYFSAMNIVQRGLKHASETSGHCKIALDYAQSDATFLYEISGEQIAFADHYFDRCSLNGKMKNRLWSIEQLQLDNLLLAADIEAKSGKWVFNFLGARMEGALLAGIEGVYHTEEDRFDGVINLLELELAALKNIPLLQTFALEYRPKGSLIAKGELQFSWIERAPGWKVDLLLNSTIRTPELKGIALRDIESCACHYISDEKLTLMELNSALCSPDRSNERAALSLGKLEFDFEQQQVSGERLSFDIPADNLSWFSNTLRYYFPAVVSEELATIVRLSKREGSLSGQIKLEVGNSSSLCQLSLEDGQYCWFDREYEVADFQLIEKNDALQVTLRSRYRNYPYWLLLQCAPPDFRSGQIVISESFDSLWEGERLIFDWKAKPSTGFQIEKAQGTFAGLGVNLINNNEVADPKTWMGLIGDISVDGRRALYLMPDELIQSLREWQFGSGYRLSGKWYINKGECTQSSPEYYFHGALQGHELEFRGYRLEQLNADLEYNPEHIYAKGLELQDPAGTLYIDELSIHAEGGLAPWILAINRLRVQNLRPCLLREVGSDLAAEITPLIIREIGVNEISGEIGDAMSFTGVGELTFTNKWRKVHFHPLLAIPTEILNRIGLDLAVLTPVSGSIYFHLADGKIKVSRFKDIYSEGKLSKFFLASKSESHIDFEGNLHLQVRMKQYNLLFKLAELFSVDVRGSLYKPSYALHKQERSGAHWPARSKKAKGS